MSAMAALRVAGRPRTMVMVTSGAVLAALVAVGLAGCSAESAESAGPATSLPDDARSVEPVDQHHRCGGDADLVDVDVDRRPRRPCPSRGAPVRRPGPVGARLGWSQPPDLPHGVGSCRPGRSPTTTRRGRRCSVWLRTPTSRGCAPSSTATGRSRGSPTRTSARGTSSRGGQSSPTRRWWTPAATQAAPSRRRAERPPEGGQRAGWSRGPAAWVRAPWSRRRRAIATEVVGELPGGTGTSDGDRVTLRDPSELARGAEQRGRPGAATTTRSDRMRTQACARSVTGVSAPRYRTCHRSRRSRRLNASGAMSCRSPGRQATTAVHWCSAGAVRAARPARRLRTMWLAKCSWVTLVDRPPSGLHLHFLFFLSFLPFLFEGQPPGVRRDQLVDGVGTPAARRVRLGRRRVVEQRLARSQSDSMPSAVVNSVWSPRIASRIRRSYASRTSP